MWPPEAIWTDGPALVEYYENMAVPLRPLPGALVASIVVSIFGSYAALLILGRRTSSRGWRNHALLFVAALCFAAVAVWGMHFVSMISVRLRPSPDITWYLRFSKGMTALSLMVPLVATTFAFWFIGSEEEFALWRIVASGIFVGLTIGLMHYSASFQLPLLNVSYSAVTVVFALILACVAATAALFLFFRLRAQWDDSWWKRILCAIFLAAAVCGMHYLGLGGTSYRTKPNTDEAELAAGSSQATRLMIAIVVMCSVIIILSFGLAIMDLITRREIRKKARHIVIASAAFHEDGRILVKNDGTIPMQMIETDADLGRVLAELDPRQSTFQWLYQLSFNWHIIRPYVPRILQAIIRRGKGKDKKLPPTERNRADYEALEFRSRFIEASVLLAQQLNLPVDAIGTLFDRVLTTGTRLPDSSHNDEKLGSRDDESSIHGITLRLHASEGVLLFLVREIGGTMPGSVDVSKGYQTRSQATDSVDQWLERGYRLTDTRFFARTLADHMGVPKPEMDVFLSACKTYAKRGAGPVVQTGGTYLGLFGVRPTTSASGLDVLVYNFARHQIPAYRLPDVQYPLTPSMRAWIRECSNNTMGEILRKANEAVHRAETSDSGSGSIQSNEDESLYEFQAAMAVAIESLSTALRCWPTLQQIARVSPEILELPASNYDEEVPAQMIVLEVILPLPEARLTPVQSRASGVQAPYLSSGRHESDKPPAPFVYTPWALFAKSQNMLIRGKPWSELCRHVLGELNKMYPLVPVDLAGEVEAKEKGQTVGNDILNPFDHVPNKNARWASRNSKVNNSKGLLVDTRPSTATSLQSPGFSEEGGEEIVDAKAGLSELRKTGSVQTFGQTPASGKSEKTMVDSDESAGRVGGGGAGGHGLGGLVDMAKGVIQGGMPGEEFGTRAAGGGGIYASIRARLDGWYQRSMRTLERSDEAAHTIDGFDWQGKCGIF